MSKNPLLQPKTMQQICEYIVETHDMLKPENKGKITADQLWSMSPTGEIYPIYSIYFQMVTYDTRISKQHKVEYFKVMAPWLLTDSFLNCLDEHSFKEAKP